MSSGHYNIFNLGIDWICKGEKKKGSEGCYLIKVENISKYFTYSEVDLVDKGFDFGKII